MTSLPTSPTGVSASGSFPRLVYFVKLFNLLFDQNMDLHLSRENSVQARCLNWNKINAAICFNYLQQQFILIQSTMQRLAQAKKGAATKVVSFLIQSHKGTQFEDAVGHPDFEGIGTPFLWDGEPDGDHDSSPTEGQSK